MQRSAGTPAATGVAPTFAAATMPAQAVPSAAAAPSSATVTATAAVSRKPAPPDTEASVAAPAPASTLGDLVAREEAAGHRIFVDGRVVGQAPGTFRLSCGAHTVKVGSEGILRSVNVPCGGSLNLEP
jgi:hypothetical protein